MLASQKLVCKYAQNCFNKATKQFLHSTAIIAGLPPLPTNKKNGFNFKTIFLSYYFFARRFLLALGFPPLLVTTK